jgi:hypothetical protein
VSDLILIRALTFRTIEWFSAPKCFLISFQMTFREVHESHGYLRDVAPHHSVIITGLDDYFCATTVVVTSNARIHGSYFGREMTCSGEVSKFSPGAIVMQLKSGIEIFEKYPKNQRGDHRPASYYVTFPGPWIEKGF